MSKNDLKIPENMVWKDEKHLKLLKKTLDSRFGEMILYQDERNKRKVMCIESSSSDKIKFKKDFLRAKNRENISTPLLQEYLGWGTFTKKELCSTHYIVKMFYEYPPSDLRNETVERKKAGTNLSDSELSLALANILDSLDYLHSKKMIHGDVRPNMISAERVGPTHEPNEFKLLDRLADSSPLERAQANNMVNNKELYMSPQLWKKINSKKNTKVEYNRFKNDIFALGMSIISAGNKSSLKNCYVKGGEFNSDNLKNHLAEFKKNYHYNPSLNNVVSHLVEVHEINRPTTSILKNGQNNDPSELYVHPENQDQDEYDEQEDQYMQSQENVMESVPYKKEQYYVQQPVKEQQPVPAFIPNIAKKTVTVENSQNQVVKTNNFFNSPGPVYTQYNQAPNSFTQTHNKTFVEPENLKYKKQSNEPSSHQYNYVMPNNVEVKSTANKAAPVYTYQPVQTNNIVYEQPKQHTIMSNKLPNKTQPSSNARVVKRIYIVKNANGDIIDKREEDVI